MASQSSENIKLNSLIKCDKLLFKRGIQGLTFSGPDPDHCDIQYSSSPLQFRSLVAAQECTGLTSYHYVMNLGV